MSASYSPLQANNKNSVEIHGPIDSESKSCNCPYPGVDDGFFNGTEKNNDGHPGESLPDAGHHPDVEAVPVKPKDPEPLEPTDDVPTIFNRFDPDGGNNPDDIDGKGIAPTNGKGDNPKEEGRDDTNSRRPSLRPFSPGFDLEVGGVRPESLPDVNFYQHKKTLAQGMMDLALFSANANQLRYVLETFSRHPYYYPSIIFIGISLVLQVAVGIGLIWNATYNVKDEKKYVKLTG
ncbi:hypothetical protein NQ317_019664 [Molorchus minor]|uniref:Ninjurin-1 n=1 Tax=Molorchus minor TaxID=1323400 RepID=A0ABQ9JJM9_9CUCU|nr:hypothetical protein NQ317_019664 [Molorchus minor]